MLYVLELVASKEQYLLGIYVRSQRWLCPAWSLYHLAYKDFGSLPVMTCPRRQQSGCYYDRLEDPSYYDRLENTSFVALGF